jgi:hypothetical protein
MGAPTSSYATAGITIRVSGALKPHHHDKVETPLVGLVFYITFLISTDENISGFESHQNLNKIEASNSFKKITFIP